MPPPLEAELPVKVLLLTVIVPQFSMPPPLPEGAELLVKVLLFTVNVQPVSLSMPPPEPLPALPPEIVIPETVTATLPLYQPCTVKTENGAALKSRWTVRFEAPGPWMEILLFRVGRTLVRSIVPSTAKLMTSWLAVLALAW